MRPTARHRERDRSPGRIWWSDSTLELSDFRTRHGFPPHLHAEAIVAVIVEGAETLHIDGRTELAATGSIVLIEPARVHRNVPIGPLGARYRGFYIPADLLWTGAAAPQLGQNVLPDERAARRLLELHEAIEQGHSSLRPQVIDELKRIFASAPTVGERCVRSEVRAAAAHLRDHCSTRVRWTELARIIGVSTGHLAREFTKAMGLPPHLYQMQYRIARAKQLIRGQLSIAQVAATCGFSDQSHLTHVFARYVGLTPGGFARAQNSTRQQAGAA